MFRFAHCILKAHLLATLYAAPLSDSTALAFISRVIVVTGRESALAIAYMFFPSLSMDSIVFLSRSVSLGFFMVSPFLFAPHHAGDSAYNAISQSEYHYPPRGIG